MSVILEDKEEVRYSRRFLYNKPVYVYLYVRSVDTGAERTNS